MQKQRFNICGKVISALKINSFSFFSNSLLMNSELQKLVLYSVDSALQQDAEFGYNQFCHRRLIRRKLALGLDGCIFERLFHDQS